MGRRANAAMGSVLVLGLLVAGCGESGGKAQTAAKSAPASTATKNTPQEHVPKESIRLSSPAFKEGGAIPARYTCDGGEVSPPLRWSAVPNGMAELILFISAAQETAPGGGELIAWAVAGLKPTLTGIAAGKLPAGAIVGRNSLGRTGYTLCPKKNAGKQNYIVALYALRQPLALRSGFAAAELLKKTVHTAEYAGLTGFAYKRA